VAADRALQAFCRDQADGTPLTAVRARAEARGYDTAPVDSTTLRIDDPAGFGRRQCELALDGQARVRQPAQAR
jgi:citrate lyase beta subunit